MISSDVLRGYHDTMILCLLSEHDSYGYEIVREIEARSGGAYTIKETTLYSALTRLQKNGLVTAYYGDESFGKRRTYFHMTAAGQQAYREKCAEWRLTKNLIDRFTGIKEK